MSRSEFGSIDRLPSGSWRIRWTVGGVKHHELLPKTWTLRQVKQRRAELQAQYGGDQYSHVPTYSELWERDVWPTLKGGRDTTVTNYVSSWKKIEPVFGSTPVSSIIAADVQDWVLANPGNSKCVLSIMRKISTRAAQLGYTDSDRLAVKMATTSVEREKRIAGDVAAYLAAVHGSPIEGAVLLMLGSGLRVGEALALPLDAVDVARKSVVIRDTVGDANGDLKGRTKTAESTRVVGISPDVVQRLAEIVACAVDRGDTYLCDDGFGRPIGKASARWQWEKATRGLPRITMQQLRPTFATRMLDAGLSERETNIAMGHKSLSAVLQGYDRPTNVVEPPTLYR